MRQPGQAPKQAGSHALLLCAALLSRQQQCCGTTTHLLAGRQQCFAACPGRPAASTPVTGLPVDEQGCWVEIESWRCLSGGRTEGWSRLPLRGLLGHLQPYKQHDSSPTQQVATVTGLSNMLLTHSNTRSTAWLQRLGRFWAMPAPCDHAEAAK